MLASFAKHLSYFRGETSFKKYMNDQLDKFLTTEGEIKDQTCEQNKSYWADAPANDDFSN